MEKKKVKKIILSFCIIILFIVIGFIAGFCTKVKIDENNLIKEMEKNSSISNLYSESEIEDLKFKVEADELEYGDNYKNIESYYPYVYKRKPDRIYFKSSKVGAFYVFENTNENYEHLLEVVEDRMYYSVIDDYNLYCFTPVSINTMITSEENYIIFDYDNDDLSEFDEDYNKDIIFSFSENTRLYRLVTYLSYYETPILKDDLPKEEFAENTSQSGYKYMTYVMSD